MLSASVTQWSREMVLGVRAWAAEERRRKYVIFFIIYLSFFLDNVLLTVVVPIIPDYLHTGSLELLADTSSPLAHLDARRRGTGGVGGNYTQQGGDDSGEESWRGEWESEGVSVGVLLSLKALVQLALNPAVGAWSGRVGCQLPLLVGSLHLLLASLLFAWGCGFWWLALARAVQGAGSAALGVAGMCLAAQLFRRDAGRSRAMAVLLGSVALGVLVGYPFGGVTYALSNKAAPFLIIAAGVLLNIFLQLLFLDFSFEEEPGCAEQEFDPEVCSGGGTVWGMGMLRSWRELLHDPPTAVSLVAIFTSTCGMAVLEPCLPIWLMTHFKPEKWQLGTVFVPDSAGYLFATSACGGEACGRGVYTSRANRAVIAVASLGLSACMIPTARSLRALLLPHALLGLSLGAADAALVPALAARVSAAQAHRSPAAAAAAIAALFSLHQTAVSGAYFIAPLLGGELMHLLGFPWCLRLVGGANVLCSLLLYFTFRRHGLDDQSSWSALEEASDAESPCAVIEYRAGVVTYEDKD